MGEEDKNNLISLLDVSIDEGKNKKNNKISLHSILSEFKDNVGEEKFQRFEKAAVKDPNQFKYVFNVYYSMAKDYIKKYTVKGIDKSIYYSGAVYSALKAFEKELRNDGYNLYNSVWFNSKDSFTKMHLLKYLDKNEIKYLRGKKLYHRRSEAIYPLWMGLNAAGILPLAKEGLITPHVYTAFLVGLADAFFVANMLIIAGLWERARILNKKDEEINYLKNNGNYRDY
ncbi:MAG: hypothetical protein BJBARM5_0452 [Candidatus Parvarchaeum acidophilus ARMAN-5]|jgi:hypothetical protein|uniref:Uncharacterized protein n=1 Tax=Candidatus Parvarchaeum acidophilus ARMAN-5 TaxID=662762 RepID=D6GVE0_PARA5|nr:MAG: hypothetical protein BJBARM5_0452 [Candidatus Parvarchaeum acidophilus ARMAN-5]